MERYTQLNAEFQRTVRRDKKSFLNEQFKEIEENNSFGKDQRSLQEKCQGKFHAKIGLTKDRNGEDLTEAEEIKNRQQGQTKELYKKGVNDPDNHIGVVIHLEPDILESDIKWTLGSITIKKASGGDGFLAELFKFLKDDAIKVPQSICQKIWKNQQWPQHWKMSGFIPIPKMGNAK